MLSRFDTPALASLAVGHGRANLLGGQRRIVEQVDQPGIGGRRLAHLRRRVGQIVDLGGDLGDEHVGNHESIREPGVETLRDIARQLEVLPLVLADGHQIGVVSQYVGGL
jgi:hypothetical protein